MCGRSDNLGPAQIETASPGQRELFRLVIWFFMLAVNNTGLLLAGRNLISGLRSPLPVPNIRGSPCAVPVLKES